MSSSSKARQRITALLDENSFVEIGAKVTARATDFNLKPEQTPSDGVITGYGVIDDRWLALSSQPDFACRKAWTRLMHSVQFTADR